MSSEKANENSEAEDEWAFVDMQGALIPKEKMKPPESKGNGKRKKRRQRKKEVEPDFEVIKDGGLTTSTIVATAQVAPFQKELSDGEDDWGIVKASEPGPCRLTFAMENVGTRVEAESLEKDDVDFIRIPDADVPKVESLSDTLSTCSFDVIDENKRKVLLENEIQIDGDDDDINDDDNQDSDDGNMIGAEFHFDFPTMVALFCLTTVLGFVIGHGVGIATSLLVVKTPGLKVPGEMSQNPQKPNPTKLQSDEENDQNESSELEGKIRMWKSMYRNEKQPQDGMDGVKFSGHLPGLKEAHKHLSLENYKLKKAYNDIQKQLDLMKVMSWYRRAQVDKLRKDDKMNMSYVVGILKKELQYLEAVYFREKRLADLWRNEKAKMESPPNTWKYFKDRWSTRYREGDEGSKEDACIDRQSCGSETRIVEDTGASNNKETVESIGTSDVSTEEDASQTSLKHREVEKRIQGEKSTHTVSSDGTGSQEPKAKRDFASVDDTSSSNAEEISHIEPVVRAEKHYLEENLFWRHLRLAKTAQEEEMQNYKAQEDYPIRVSSEERASGDDTVRMDSEAPNEGSETTMSSSGGLAQPETDWSSLEVLEQDGELIIANENKDSITHVLYGFFHDGFREIELSPGGIFVMSVKIECLKMNSGFEVSVINKSPKPIKIFALLPNGKITRRTIDAQVRVTFVELAGRGGGESETKPLIYEAVVSEDGKLKVREQNNGESGEDNSDEVEENCSDGKSGELGNKNREYGDESFMNEDQSGGENLNVGEHDDEELEEESTREENDPEQKEGEKVLQPEQEVPLWTLMPSESHVFDQPTGKIYRHTVSAHQYPISDYETLLTQIRRNDEKIYYRFPRDMIVEKFVVKVQVVKTKADGSISTDGDDEGSVWDTPKDSEPISYDEDVSSIVDQLLKNPWKDGHRSPIFFTYDEETAAVTSIYVTLSRVHPDDVISQDVLKNGKLETFGENRKFTSYRLHGNELLRIVREDEVKQAFTGTAEALEETNGEAHQNLEKAEENFTDNQEDGNPSNFHSEDKDSENANFSHVDNMDVQGLSSNDFIQEDSLEATSLGYKQESKKCVLRLDERKINEYWALTLQHGVTFIRETVERVMPTPKYKADDLAKLNVSTDDIEESVSYVYCEDGSVQKTWSRIEKALRNGARGDSDNVDSREDSENGESDKDRYTELQENWTDDDHDEYDDHDDEYDIGDDYDYDEQHDDIDDGNSDDIAHDDKDKEDDYHSYNDNDDDDDEDSDDDDEDDNADDEDGDEEFDKDDDRDTYSDDHDNGSDYYDPDDVTDNENENQHEANDPDYNRPDDQDSNDSSNDNHDHVSDKLNPELEKYSKETSSEGGSENSNIRKNDKDFEGKLEKEKDLKYGMFISREWQNLKLQQQQFEYRKKQHQLMQKKMMEEWKIMKEQYWEFQKNFKRSHRSESKIEFGGLWNDMKHQQKQFDDLKKQFQEELRKSLQHELEKLKQKQEAIEIRERESKKGKGLQVDKGEDINEQLEAKRESGYEKDTLISGKGNFQSYLRPEVEVELKNVVLQRQGSHVHLGQGIDEGYVERMESDAWDMTDSYTSPQNMEENLPHELPYISKTDELNVDKKLSEDWELGTVTSNNEEEKHTHEENRPQELPFIPISHHDTPGVDDGVFKIHEMQEMFTEESVPQSMIDSQLIKNDGESEEKDYESGDESGDAGGVPNIAARQNMEDGFRENLLEPVNRENVSRNQANEPVLHERKNGLSNFNAEDVSSSSEQEQQIQKLREELDKLYKAKTSRRNELQVVKSEMEQTLYTKPGGVVQPKCSPKCPQTSNLSECPPKCPIAPDTSTENFSPRYNNAFPPNKHLKKLKLRPLPKGPEKDTKKESFTMKSKRNVKPASEMKTNDQNKNNVKSQAFTDFIEGHSYLRQLEPVEYGEKMQGESHGLLALHEKGDEGKSHKRKFKQKKDGNGQPDKKSKKKRKQKKYLKKESNDGFDDSLRNKKNKRKVRNAHPSSPQTSLHRAKKYPEKIRKSKGEK